MSKKIAIITLEFPPTHGGIATYLKNIARILAQKFQIIIVVPKINDNETSRHDFNDASEQYKIIRKNILFPKIFWPRWAKCIFICLSLYFRENAKVFFTPNVLPIGYCFYFLRPIIKVPYIINIHGLDIRLAKKSSWKSYWLKKILNKSSLIVVNSEYTKNEVLSVSGLQKKEIIIAYPCPDSITPMPQDDIENLKNRLAIDEDNVVVLSIGRLIKRKGFDRVLLHLSEIVTMFPKVIYIIAGSGPEMDNLGKIVIENNLQNFVRIVGDISDQERTGLYSISNIFVLPAREDKNDIEGFGIVYLEAAQFGIPSIASNAGGAAEAVIHGETGLVFGSSTINLDDAIKQFLADPIYRNTLGSNARARVNSEFIWEHQVSKLIPYLNKYVG